MVTVIAVVTAVFLCNRSAFGLAICVAVIDVFVSLQRFLLQ